jgi:hypothetical protein
MKKQTDLHLMSIVADEKILPNVVAMLNQEPYARHFLLMPELRGRYPEQFAKAEAEFDAVLRRCFDQWIDSGKSGVDRIVDSAEDRSIRAVPPGYEQPLLDVLTEWSTSERLGVMFDKSGRTIIIYPHLDVDGIVKTPRMAGRNYAIGWFKRLLDLPDCLRLARCTDCRMYFAYTKKPKGAAKNGTFCDDCKSAGGRHRMRSTREHRKATLISIASEFWPKWQPMPRYGKRSVWVAQQVNRCTSKNAQALPNITGKWITQNQVAIEEEVERRKHDGTR